MMAEELTKDKLVYGNKYKYLPDGTIYTYRGTININDTEHLFETDECSFHLMDDGINDFIEVRK